MGIRRACSYQATIQTPVSPANYSVIVVTIAQDDQILVSKDLSELVTDESTVMVQLTQEETAQFEAGVPAYMQIRCYAGIYDAPGSTVWQVDVWPSLDDTILPGGT